MCPLYTVIKSSPCLWETLLFSALSYYLKNDYVIINSVKYCNRVMLD